MYHITRDVNSATPEIVTHWGGGIPNSEYGHAVGWCPALGRGLGFRPNAPEVVKPDLYIFPGGEFGVILSDS
jgi:hypothetical protein